MTKPIDSMTIKQLERKITSLEKKTYKHEWQYEFTRQEIKELRSLIRSKQTKGGK